MVSKPSKQAKKTLSKLLYILEEALDLALQKEEIEAIIGIADRMFALYQFQLDNAPKRVKVGFSLRDEEDEDGPDER